jgi:hypothetical protein
VLSRRSSKGFFWRTEEFISSATMSTKTVVDAMKVLKRHKASDWLSDDCFVSAEGTSFVVND